MRSEPLPGVHVQLEIFEHKVSYLFAGRIIAVLVRRGSR